MQIFSQIAFHTLQIIELNPISFSPKPIAIYVSGKRNKEILQRVIWSRYTYVLTRSSDNKAAWVVSVFIFPPWLRRRFSYRPTSILVLFLCYSKVTAVELFELSQNRDQLQVWELPRLNVNKNMQKVDNTENGAYLYLTNDNLKCNETHQNILHVTIIRRSFKTGLRRHIVKIPVPVQSSKLSR